MPYIDELYATKPVSVPAALTAACAEVDRLRGQVDNLVTMSRRLVREVRKGAPDSPCAERALNYLKLLRKEGRPLR